jgi:hypothetical protein
LQKVVFVREAKSSEGTRIDDDDDEDVPATKKNADVWRASCRFFIK